uniref:Uncharacterized protein n=1 Tax=Kalanchoe fedtschenkoi TaxID=63787 RepID=A0A7N0ZSV6_KALFE
THHFDRAFAFQLASKGLSLILLDRDQAQLEATKRALHQEFGDKIEVRCLVVDLNKLSKDEIVKAIRDGIDGVDVGILINNAGVAYTYPRFLHEADPDATESVLNVNAGAPTWATMAVLPSMMKKKRGAIVNMGSASAHVLDAYPLVSIYGATKAYIEHFSRSISVEYGRYGIDVQCQAPSYIATKMTRRTQGSLFVPTAETWCQASARWIGYDTVCNPYWPHYLMSMVFHMIPNFVLDWYFMRSNLQARDFYMKKDADRAESEENGKKII